jgi:hypothetical protein
VSLYERLEEYAGIGGRVAGARHPFRIPQPQVRTRKDMTPEMVEKAKRRQEMRAKTREYLRQIALGEGRRQLKTPWNLNEAQLDVGKAKIMAKNLRKILKDNEPINLPLYGVYSGHQFFNVIVDQLEKTGAIDTNASEHLVKCMTKIVEVATKRDPKKAAAVKKWLAGTERMHKLNVDQAKKDKAAARKKKKAALKTSDVKKFSYVFFFKGGKDHSGKIMWVGPNKFKKGQMSYGVKVVGEKKLVYIDLGHIYDASPPAPAYKKQDVDDGDKWVDANKDMNAELGTKGVWYGKSAIKRHFGW